VENVYGMMCGMVERAVDTAETAGSHFGHYYRNTGRELREIAKNTAVVDLHNAGAINTARGGNWRSYMAENRSVERMETERPLAASDPADGTTPRHPEIVRGTVADMPGVVHALLEGCRKAYGVLPGAETGGVDRLIADMASRKYQQYTKVLSDGTPAVFVHRSPDGTVTGFVEAAFRPDGAGQLYSWHVLPEAHQTGVGRALMRKALDFLGDVDVYSGTTIRTAAYPAHLRLGFEPIGAPTETPPPMLAAGLVGEQQDLLMTRAARAALLRRWDQQAATSELG